ncbi:VOC family protein [Acidicapsa ligni]|uniref:VOC family protein n=1 Tax=Acidicapsa ligni TaxID=542300 RepID=UPI0021E0DAE9|nr:VOC family protein [Acidicapsa ligni]
MTIKAKYATPMRQVMDVERSIVFYELLGFELIDKVGNTRASWARLHCEGGSLMLLVVQGQLYPKVQTSSLVMYTADLIGFREQLRSAGLEVPEIVSPDWMRSGEIRMFDPDGYSVTICHWGHAEQEAWEKRIGADQK